MPLVPGSLEVDLSPSLHTNNVQALALSTRPLQGEEMTLSNVIMKAIKETKACLGELQGSEMC